MYDTKIIFLFPPRILTEERIILEMMEREFEFFYLSDLALTERILPDNRDSIWFANIENPEVLEILEKSNVNNWDIEKPSLKLPRLYVLYPALPSLDKLPAPFVNDNIDRIINTSAGWKILLTEILSCLDMTSLRGKRQYVRLNCEKDETAGFFFKSGPIDYTGSILDISIGGVAIKFNQKHELTEGKTVNGLLLLLGLFKCHVSGTVIRVAGSKLVIIFHQNAISIQEREAIHKYMFHSRQKQISERLTNRMIPSTEEPEKNEPEKKLPHDIPEIKEKRDPIEQDLYELLVKDPER